MQDNAKKNEVIVESWENTAWCTGGEGAGEALTALFFCRMSY